MSIKKQALGFYFNSIALVAGILALILSLVGNVISPDNALGNVTQIMLAGLVALLAVVIAIYLPNKLGNYDPVSTIAILVAIVLYTYIFGQIISQRVMLVAGLFTFNSGNVEGWKLFYFIIAAAICWLLGIISLIISSFAKAVKR